MSATPLNDKFQDTVLFTTIYPTPNTVTVQQFKEHTGIGTQKVELAMGMNTKKWQKTENKWCIYLYLSHQIEIIYCAAFKIRFYYLFNYVDSNKHYFYNAKMVYVNK